MENKKINYLGRVALFPNTFYSEIFAIISIFIIFAAYRGLLHHDFQVRVASGSTSII